MVRIVKQKHWWSLKVLEKWETANPKWRPKKWISLINDKLKKKWYEPVTKQDIETNYMSLLQLPEKELKKMVSDIKQPMLVRILIKNMLSWKGFEVIEKMLDRWIWKSKQPTEEFWEKQIQIKIINYEEKN